MGYFWYGSWNYFELVPAGSATPGGIAFISRIKTHMEAWFVSREGFVEGIYFYDDGKGWRRYRLRPNGSAALGTKISALSRAPSHMELWWISPRGSVEATFWYDHGSNWRLYQLAPPGRAVAKSGLTSVSKEPRAMKVWWVAPNGSIHGLYLWDVPKWNQYSLPGSRYQLAGEGSASLTWGIGALHRNQDTEKIFWITPIGGPIDAYWYSGMTSWGV